MALEDSLPISELPSADPLTGSELIPLVQDGQTRRTTASNFTGFVSVAFRDVPFLGLVADNVWYDVDVFTIPAGKKWTLDCCLFVNASISSGVGSIEARIFDATVSLPFPSTLVSLAFLQDGINPVQLGNIPFNHAYDNSFGVDRDFVLQVQRVVIFPTVVWTTSAIESGGTFGNSTAREIFFG